MSLLSDDSRSYLVSRVSVYSAWVDLVAAAVDGYGAHRLAVAYPWVSVGVVLSVTRGRVMHGGGHVFSTPAYCMGVGHVSDRPAYVGGWVLFVRPPECPVCRGSNVARVQ